MGKFPVFQSPAMDTAEKCLKMGFYGQDTRSLVQILNTDDAAVRALGLTHTQIAGALERITDMAKAGFGEPVDIGQDLVASIQMFRGKRPCPFGHPGLFPKTHVTLTNTRSKETLAWSELSIHLIREHGFYQGKGSPYRLEPEDIRRMLEL